MKPTPPAFQAQPPARQFNQAKQFYLVALLATAVYLQGACAGERVVFGHVPPSTFHFTTVVQHRGPGSGGWQVAQVLILLGYLSAFFPRDAVCDVEVGVPLVNGNGPVSASMAQREAAYASDHAARDVMQNRAKPTATACELFRNQMEYYLRDEEIGTIPGARVSKFRTWPVPVPRRTYPASRGE